MQGGTAMNSPLSDLFGQGFILPGGRVINQGGTARERLCMDIFHGGVFFIFKSGGQNEFQ